jgi:hypothetical protein
MIGHPIQFLQFLDLFLRRFLSLASARAKMAER